VASVLDPDWWQIVATSGEFQVFGGIFCGSILCSEFYVHGSHWAFGYTELTALFVTYWGSYSTPGKMLDFN
jgi:hypothetical protein